MHRMISNILGSIVNWIMREMGLAEAEAEAEANIRDLAQRTRKCIKDECN